MGKLNKESGKTKNKTKSLVGEKTGTKKSRVREHRLKIVHGI